MRPTGPAKAGARVQPDSRTQEILSAQIRLLHSNVNVAVGVTILAASTLVHLQRGAFPDRTLYAWWLYMVLVSVLRWTMALRYRRASRVHAETGKWRAVFTTGAALAGTGWGIAGVLLYADGLPGNQIALLFVLGGMMLGGAPLLAPRPEAFLSFMIPAGLAPAVRLLLQGDETHVAMGMLAAVFTLAIVITTGRIYETIATSLRLQFEKRDLVEDLRAARNQTEELNQALELRVQERTAELRHSTEQLRAEIAQRLQMEEELLRARKLESLGVLAGGIAHDFNNFLTIVQGNVEVARKTAGTHDPVQELLDQTASACQRAAFLSSQLLTFAKGGAPVRRLVSIAKLVMDAVHLARAGARSASRSRSRTICGARRSTRSRSGRCSTTSCSMRGRRCPRAGSSRFRRRTWKPRTTPDDPRMRISIRDYGRGISGRDSPAHLRPIFHDQGDGQRAGPGDCAFDRCQAWRHITVQSKPGEGSVFTIDLRRRRLSRSPRRRYPWRFPPARDGSW